ncbi:MAG: hypothetical protein O7D32_05575 [bacterium]|nr:hypothetical protein [bacterium]
MKALLKTYLVYLLSCSMVVCTLPRRSRAASTWKGEASGDDAVASASALTTPSDSFNSLRYDGWKAAFARSDSTGYEFPEDEDDNHLIRDVAVFLVVSAFLAFFIIKVFLEGDEADEPVDEGGKELPPF